MKNITIVLLLFAMIVNGFTQNNKLLADSTDAYILSLMKYYNVPGMSVAVVEEGSIIYSGSFGVRSINRPEKVDSNTLFAIGSISKSFTALAVGILVDEGKLHWDEFIHQKIFEPLGMHRSVTSYNERQNENNIVAAHINKNGKTIEIEQERLDNIAPAASIYSTATDMAKYMNFLLNEGVIGFDTLVTPYIIREIFTPHIIYPRFGKPVQNEFTSYGFGWWLTQRPFFGKSIDHSGGIDGATANLLMHTNSRRGIIAMSNAYEKIVFPVTYHLMGKLTNDSTYMIFANSVFQKQTKPEIANTGNITEADYKISPDIDGSQYCGTYSDIMYGNIYIEQNNRNIEIRFEHTPLFYGKLIHKENNTFFIDWYDARMPNGELTFVSEDKEITAIQLNQTNLLDVDFSELNIKKQNE